MPLLASMKPIHPARKAAESILALAVQLPAIAKPVFAAWLARHTQGCVPFPNRAGLSLWLSGLSTGHIDAQYRLILLEIAWLELAVESSQPGETILGQQKSHPAGN